MSSITAREREPGGVQAAPLLRPQRERLVLQPHGQPSYGQQRLSGALLVSAGLLQPLLTGWAASTQPTPFLWSTADCSV